MNRLHLEKDPTLASEFNLFVKEYEADLYKFIGYEDTANFQLDKKINTFYFNPQKKLIGVPLQWFQDYLKDKNNPNHLMTAKIGLAHEFSHFRDMLREKISTGKGSMYEILQKLSKKKILIGNGKFLPIGEKIHTFYNCIDDIIINEEVMRFIPFGLTKKDFHKDYQEDAFADYKKQKGGNYRLTPQGMKAVEEGTGDHILNTTQAVDYWKYPNAKALAYFFLRNAMVGDQKILLSEGLTSILFSPSGKKLSRRKSFEQTYQFLEKSIAHARESKDPEIKKKYELLKSALQTQLLKLKGYDNNKLQTIQTTINKARSEISQSYDTTKINPMMISLYDLVYSLSLSKGKDTNHQLCIMPALRYQIYEQVFEPLLETLILIDALQWEIQEWQGKTSAQNWESEEQEWESEKQEWEGKEQEWNDEKQEWNDESQKIPYSGKGTYNRNLEEHMKELEELADYQHDQETKKALDQQKKNAELQIASLTESYGVSEAEVAFTNQVKKNFQEYTASILEILYKELETLDMQINTTKTASKKWKLNYDQFMDALPSSYLDGNFDQKNIYERTEFSEFLEKDFKKLLFYFVLDVSGSTERFRNANGLMNGIMTSLTIALKNVEKKIQTLLADPNYSIPIKFVIYTDSVVYFSKNADTEPQKPYELELIKVNHLLNTISWGTNDVQWWKQISKCMVDDLQSSEGAVKEIEDWKMKPVVLQISDSDVTDYGLQELQNTLTTAFGEEVEKRLLAKRIILWETRETSYTEEELKAKGIWSPEIIKDVHGKEIIKDGKKLINIKEVWIRSKKEIIEQIALIFQNFFADVQRKK